MDALPGRRVAALEEADQGEEAGEALLVPGAREQRLGAGDPQSRGVLLGDAPLVGHPHTQEAVALAVLARAGAHVDRHHLGAVGVRHGPQRLLHLLDGPHPGSVHKEARASPVVSQASRTVGPDEAAAHLRLARRPHDPRPVARGRAPCGARPGGGCGPGARRRPGRGGRGPVRRAGPGAGGGADRLDGAAAAGGRRTGRGAGRQPRQPAAAGRGQRAAGAVPHLRRGGHRAAGRRRGAAAPGRRRHRRAGRVAAVPAPPQRGRRGRPVGP